MATDIDVYPLCAALSETRKNLAAFRLDNASGGASFSWNHAGCVCCETTRDAYAEH